MKRAKKHFGFGGRFFRWRNALGTAFALLLLLCPWGRMEVEPWQVGLGLALALAGVGLRIWAILQIGGSARKKSKLKAVRVITWGPFAMVRNPIYIANMTVFAGFVVLSGLLWALPLVVGGLWLWYDALIRREESFLRATFPVEYGAYAERTHRWLPTLRVCRRPAEIPVYPLVRALHRERSHLLLVAGGVLVFWALSALHHGTVLALHDPARVGSPRRKQQQGRRRTARAAAPLHPIRRILQSHHDCPPALERPPTARNPRPLPRIPLRFRDAARARVTEPGFFPGLVCRSSPELSDRG